MIQRFDERTPRTMLALPSAGLATAMPRAGSTLALPSGDIAGDLRDLGPVKGKGGRRAQYELLIGNNTPTPVAAFAYALGEDGPAARVTWDAIVVPAYSAVSVGLELALPPGRNKPHMVAEIYANGLQLTLDPKAPPASVSGRPGNAMRKPIAAFAAFALLVAGAIGVSDMKPRLMALAAPDTVTSGQPFDVAYIAHSADDASYTVDTPDGQEVASGPLDPHAGSFSVALPGGAVSQGYDVRVVAHGRLGTAERSVHVVALPPPAPPRVAVAPKPPHPLKITRVKLASDAVDGGQPIVVSYRSTVNSGSVRLMDQYGTVRAEALLSPRGTSTLAAPFVDTDQDLTVLITAQRGAERVRAAIPVTVRRVDQVALAQQRLAAATVPAVAPAAAAAVPAPAGGVAAPAVPAAAPQTAAEPAVKGPTVSDGTADDGAAAVAGGPPIEVAPSQVAGRAVAIHVLRHYPGLRVALMGPGGEEVVSSAVSSAESTVLLAPPNLSAGRGGYSIVATFSRGVGEETLIRPIAFH